MLSPLLQSRRTLRVLVVEDEPRLRDLLCDVIPEMGFVAEAVRSAELAWPMIQADPPDALILDLQLPLMGGLDLLEKVRAAELGCAAIVLSGFGDLRSAQRAIELGVTSFLSKPFDLGDIENALGKVGRDRQPTEVPIAADRCPTDAQPAAATLAENQYQLIRAALSRNNSNRTAAAMELGISRRTLHHKIAQYRTRGLPFE